MSQYRTVKTTSASQTTYHIESRISEGWGWFRCGVLYEDEDVAIKIMKQLRELQEDVTVSYIY